MTTRTNSKHNSLSQVAETVVGDALIRYDRIGSGPPIVFLHGLLGLKEHFKPCAQSLSHRAECWMLQAPLLELRGAQCSVQGASEMIDAFLDTHVGQPAVLVGNSLGGHIGLRIALDHPEKVRGLVLSGSSGLFERTFEKDVQHRPSRDWLNRKITDLFFDPTRMPQGVIDRAFEELSQRKSARALVRLSRTAKADHMGERLPMIQTPTLLLWGRQDTVTPPSVAEEFASLLPNAQLVWIEKCGHTSMIERPEAFTAGIERFLDQLEIDTPDSEARQEVA